MKGFLIGFVRTLLALVSSVALSAAVLGLGQLAYIATGSTAVGVGTCVTALCAVGGLLSAKAS